MGPRSAFDAEAARAGRWDCAISPHIRDIEGQDQQGLDYAKVLGEKSIGSLAAARWRAPCRRLLNTRTQSMPRRYASDPHADRAQDLEKRFGVATTSDNLKAAKNADIVILSVKPQMLRFVFRDLCGKLRKDALVLSIIAGARVESISQGLKHSSIVRSMPNTPAQVAEGMTVWTANAGVSPAQRSQAQTILRAFGKELTGRGRPTATAISGWAKLCGHVHGSVIDAAVHLGFSREDGARRDATCEARLSMRKIAVASAELRNPSPRRGHQRARANQIEKGGFRTRRKRCGPFKAACVI